MPEAKPDMARLLLVLEVIAAIMFSLLLCSRVSFS